MMTEIRVAVRQPGAIPALDREPVSPFVSLDRVSAGGRLLGYKPDSRQSGARSVAFSSCRGAQDDICAAAQVEVKKVSPKRADLNRGPAVAEKVVPDWDDLNPGAAAQDDICRQGARISTKGERR